MGDIADDVSMHDYAGEFEVLDSSPTEDTPTPDFRPMQPAVTPVRQDDNSQGEQLDSLNDGTESRPPDLKQLREAIIQVMDLNTDLETGGVEQELVDTLADNLTRYFTTAQLQLVSELEGKLPKKERIREGSAPNTVERKMTVMWNRGFNEAITQAAVLLEHKKQELERGK